MSGLPQTDFLTPNWPVPANVKALSTTRAGGMSTGTYAGLNLATHVGDHADAVQRNRGWLLEHAGLPAAPRWLNQVHGRAGVHADKAAEAPTADWSWTDTPEVVCAVLTADCLPVLLSDRAGQRVAAVHAGWRGLCSGVLETAVGQFADVGIKADKLLVWFGPAIGAAAYEVDGPVRRAFIDHEYHCSVAFTASRPGHWQLDLVAAARALLAAAGVTSFYGGHHCTFNNANLYSHRREAPCGRQATLIWLSH